MADRTTPGDDEPPGKAARPRLTIRWLMLIVLLAACVSAQWSCLQRWEARRVHLYQRRDLANSVLQEAAVVLAATRPIAPRTPAMSSSTATRHWSLRLELLERREGGQIPVVLVEVSQSNGTFGLRPITIEPSGLEFDEEVVDRLDRAFRERGWAFRIERPSKRQGRRDRDRSGTDR